MTHHDIITVVTMSSSKINLGTTNIPQLWITFRDLHISWITTDHTIVSEWSITTITISPSTTTIVGYSSGGCTFPFLCSIRLFLFLASSSFACFCVCLRLDFFSSYFFSSWCSSCCNASFCISFRCRIVVVIITDTIGSMMHGESSQTQTWSTNQIIPCS